MAVSSLKTYAMGRGKEGISLQGMCVVNVAHLVGIVFQSSVGSYKLRESKV